MGWRLPSSVAHDAHLLRQVRSAGSACRAAVCEHVARSSGASGCLAQRSFRWAEILLRTLRRLLSHDLAARGQMLHKSADDAMLPDDPEFRAAFVAYLEWGSRIGRENSQQHAAPPPNMPVPRWWWVCNATPGARTSALAPSTLEKDTMTTKLPGPEETPSFERHIKN